VLGPGNPSLTATDGREHRRQLDWPGGQLLDSLLCRKCLTGYMTHQTRRELRELSGTPDALSLRPSGP
jgi:hypothetical protein